jgi:hypothetical protein
MRAALVRESPASFEGRAGCYCKDLVKQGYHTATIRGEVVYYVAYLQLVLTVSYNSASTFPEKPANAVIRLRMNCHRP